MTAKSSFTFDDDEKLNQSLRLRIALPERESNCIAIGQLHLNTALLVH